jgi:hypothetical protein
MDLVTSACQINFVTVGVSVVRLNEIVSPLKPRKEIGFRNTTVPNIWMKR